MTRTASYRNTVYELALENNGIVTTAQAKRFGVPAVELRKLAQRRAISRVGHGVYRSPYFPAGPQVEAAEAIEIVGDQAFLFGESVLSLLDIGSLGPRKVLVGHTNPRLRKNLPAFIRPVYVGSTAPKITNYMGIRCVEVETVLKSLALKISRDKLLEAVLDAERMQYISSETADEILMMAQA